MTVLADTRAAHIINASLASIDLPEWLFSLSDRAFFARDIENKAKAAALVGLRPVPV